MFTREGLFSILQNTKSHLSQIFSLKLLGFAVILVGLPVTVYLSQNQAIFQQHAAKSAQMIKMETLAQATGSVVETLEVKYNTVKPEEKQATLNSLSSAAKQHYQYMQLLLDNNDLDGFTSSAISKTVYDKVPNEIKPYVEEVGTTNGVFESVHGDNIKHGDNIYFNSLLGDDKKQYSLRFGTGAFANVSHLARTTVPGVKLGSTIVLNSAINSQGQSSASVHSALGNNTAAVVLINFQEDPNNKPATKEEIKQSFFNLGVKSVNKFMQEASYNQVHFVGKKDPTGDVFGWFTLPEDPPLKGECSYQDWMNEADSFVLRNEGVNLSNYQYVIYAFVAVPCGDGFQGGMAFNQRQSITVGAFEKWSEGYEEWIGIVNHELGHNFGLKHAGGLICPNNVPIGENCETVNNDSQYYDVYDIMGGRSRMNGKGEVTSQYSNFEKRKIGWIQDSSILTINPPGGTIPIFPIENSRGTIGVRIPRKDQSGKLLNYFFLEYRQPIPSSGFDGSISDEDKRSITNGILIRLASEYNKDVSCPGSVDTGHGRASVCSDTEFVTTNPSKSDYELLSVGQTFFDPITKISLQLVSPPPGDICQVDNCKEVKISFTSIPTPTSFVNTCTNVIGQYCVPDRQNCRSGDEEVQGKCDVNNRQVCCGPKKPGTPTPTQWPTPTPRTNTCTTSVHIGYNCVPVTRECSDFGDFHQTADYCVSATQICCAPGGNSSTPTPTSRLTPTPTKSPTPTPDVRLGCDSPNYCTGGGSFNYCDGVIDDVHYKCSTGSCCKRNPTPTPTPKIFPTSTPTPAITYPGSNLSSPYCSKKGGRCSSPNRLCGTGYQELNATTLDCGEDRFCCMPINPNPCATANCGQGGYCGNLCGLKVDKNVMYYCSGTCKVGQGSCTVDWNKSQQCSVKCQQNPSGSDYCIN